MGRRKIAKGDKLTGRVLSKGASDMTEGVIWKQLLQFSVPMAVGLLFQQLYNTVDAVVVGNFVGKEALAAVGSTSSIINMLVGLSAGLSTGASVLISQRYGAHDDRGLRDAVHTSIAATLVLCVFATAVGMLIVDPMHDVHPRGCVPAVQNVFDDLFCGHHGAIDLQHGLSHSPGGGRQPPAAVFPVLLGHQQHHL